MHYTFFRSNPLMSIRLEYIVTSVSILISWCEFHVLMRSHCGGNLSHLLITFGHICYAQIQLGLLPRSGGATVQRVTQMCFFFQLLFFHVCGI